MTSDAAENNSSPIRRLPAGPQRYISVFASQYLLIMSWIIIEETA